MYSTTVFPCVYLCVLKSFSASCSSSLCLTGLEVEAAMAEYFCLPSTSCSFYLTHKSLGADMHKCTHTHTHTHGTHSLSLCVQPWRLQQKPFILSGSQSFRPIRDTQCSEGIQTQQSSIRTTVFFSTSRCA